MNNIEQHFRHNGDAVREINAEVIRDQAVLVMKFGGKSVGSAQAIEETVGFVDYHTRDGRPIVIVVSAMNGVTDNLVSLCDSLDNTDNRKAENLYHQIEDKHINTIVQLNMDDKCRLDIICELQPLFNLIRREIIRGRNITSEDRDRILSYGERMSARIVGGRLRRLRKTKVIDSTDIIQTDATFSNAQVDIVSSRSRVQKIIFPLLQQGIIPVVTGFVGATEDGRITTLGRNSSDFSATLVGNMLDAKEVWICKDVDGIFTSDPKVNSTAECIDVMSQQTALYHLQNGGDKVLCIRALEPILGTNIILRVRNVRKPEKEGTLILPEITPFSESV